MTRKELHDLWISAGGNFHGPIVESGSIPASNLLKFVNLIIKNERERCAEICETAMIGKVATNYDWTKTVGIELAKQIRNQ